MRLLIAAVVMLAAVLGPCGVYAQEDDGWGEIVGLMNGLTAANQQLLQQGVQPGFGGAGGLTPGFLQGLAGWSRTYADVLQSVDGAFDVDGAQQGAYDPFGANAPNPLWDELNRWQATAGDQGADGYRNIPRYRTYQNPRNLNLRR